MSIVEVKSREYMEVEESGKKVKVIVEGSGEESNIFFDGNESELQYLEIKRLRKVANYQ